jgi:hypothetical protein
MPILSPSRRIWAIAGVLAVSALAPLGGCSEEFTSTSSSGAGAAGASGGEGAAGGAGGAGGGGSETAYIYLCSCFVQLPNGSIQTVDAHVCSDEAGAQAACEAECLAFDDDLNDAWLDYSYGTKEVCDFDLGQKLLSGGVPSSGEVRLDAAASHLTVHLDGADHDVPIRGDVLFTGGCEGSSCEVAINHIHMEADGVAIGTGAAAIQVRDIRVLNVGSLTSRHEGGYFQIPSELVRLNVNAELAGQHRAGWFLPAAGQDLHGYYLPSTGDFAIFGELYSETQSVSLELHGTARNRPPTANAGPARRVFAAASGAATVTLDGRQTFDLDDDLQDILWYEGSKYLGKGMTPTITLSLGKHTVTARAIDATHKWNDADTTIEVLKK